MTGATRASLVDRRTIAQPSMDLWEPVVVRADEIEAALDQLATGSAGVDGRREVSVVHPRSSYPAMGLAPGIEATFGILLPGESTVIRRRNSSDVHICLRGEGTVEIGPARHRVGRYDCSNTPGMHPHRLQATGNEPFVYLAESNAPFLERLGVHYLELDPPHR